MSAATESMASYFKLVFEKHPDWLAERKSEGPLGQYSTDHPEATAADLKKAKSALNNVKSLLRKEAGTAKPRKPRAEKAARKPRAVASNGNGSNGHANANGLGASIRALIESVAREEATTIASQVAGEVARDTARQEVREAIESAAK